MLKSSKWLSAVVVLVAVCTAIIVSGCSQQDGKDAPTYTAKPAENEGESPANASEMDQDHETQGHVFDVKTAKVGDKILGMEITELSVHDISDKHYSTRVKFSGQATVSGTYTHERKDDEMLGGRIRFEVDDEYGSSLPKEKTDSRILWFVFANHDEAEALLGPPGSSGRATVVIGDYGINATHSDEWNTANLVRVVQKRSFVRSEDIDDIDISRLRSQILTSYSPSASLCLELTRLKKPWRVSGS